MRDSINLVGLVDAQWHMILKLVDEVSDNFWQTDVRYKVMDRQPDLFNYVATVRHGAPKCPMAL